MAKYYGSNTKSGKVGGSVFAKYPGVLVERQYNPFVKNPKSAEQTKQRAKMKLASQLAAIFGKDRLSGYKAIGMRSSRNQFVSGLFSSDAIGYQNGVASINMSKVRLTASRVDYFNTFTTTRNGSTLEISGRLLSPYVSKVVGIRIIVTEPRAIGGSVLDLAITSDVTVVPENGQFSTSINTNASLGCNVFVYAYSIADSRAYVRYTDLMTTSTSEAVALNTVRTENPDMMDYSVTYAKTLESA